MILVFATNNQLLKPGLNVVESIQLPRHHWSGIQPSAICGSFAHEEYFTLLRPHPWVPGPDDKTRKRFYKHLFPRLLKKSWSGGIGSVGSFAGGRDGEKWADLSYVQKVDGATPGGCVKVELWKRGLWQKYVLGFWLE